MPALAKVEEQPDWDPWEEQPPGRIPRAKESHEVSAVRLEELEWIPTRHLEARFDDLPADAAQEARRHVRGHETDHSSEPAHTDEDE